MLRQSLSAVLGRTSLFRGQPPGVLAAIGEAMHDARYAAGTLIFTRGDPGDALFVVAEGRVRLSILTEDGRELSFAHALPADVFGEIAVLDGSPRSANAMALTEVQAFRLHRLDFNRLVDRHSTFARAVIRLLCSRIREVSDHLEDIALLPLSARLARFFLNRVSSLPPATASRVSLGMSQNELALLLGASRPKVNAALMTLVHSGAIVRDGEEFTCNARILADLAHRRE